MMEKFAIWFRTYNTEITWWLIGWMAFAAFDALGKGLWFAAAFDAGIAYFNYYMWKTRDL